MDYDKEALELETGLKPLENRTGDLFSKSGPEYMVPRIRTPWKMLNEGLLGGEWGGLAGNGLNVIVAGSGVGKSTTVREFLYYFILSGTKVGAFMLEESPNDFFMSILGIETSIVDRGKPYPEWSQADKDSINAAKEKMKPYIEENLWLYNDEVDGELLLEHVEQRFKEMVDWGAKIIVLDNITAVANSGDIDANSMEATRIAKVARQLSKVAAMYNVCVITIVQANRNAMKANRLGMDNIQGSSGIPQSSSMVFGLVKATPDEGRKIKAQDNSNTTDNADYTILHMIKARLPGCNKAAEIGMKFNKSTWRYTPVALFEDGCIPDDTKEESKPKPKRSKVEKKHEEENTDF